MNESSPGRIFVSYRRQETAWPAGRLYDALVEHFAAEQVFKDVDNIEPGEDFVERITAAVGSCDVLLVLIGPQWLTITDENGQRRLDNPEDYVRLEIEAALKRKIRVIPILVDDAPMPRANQLPASLAALVRRNAVEINPLTFDTKRLMTTVHKTLAELKVPDTSTGSESPILIPRSDRSNQQVAEPEVEQLYDRALAAFWTERWDEAVDLLGQVLSRQPDYADAARKLELARRQQQLAVHYAEGSAATDAGDWEQAAAEYTRVVDIDPGYRDTNRRLANARHQQQLASLQAEAHRLHHAGQWAAVIKVGEQLQAIDPAAADPDGLMTSARAELAAEQQAARLAADYRTGLRLINAGRWKEAVEALERVTLVDSTYQDAPALLDRARQELRQVVGGQGPPDQREPTKESRAAGIPPAAPGTPAGDQPPADQTQPSDKLSDGLGRRGRLITMGVVVAVALLVGLAGMIAFNPDVDTEPPAPTGTVANTTSPLADEIVFEDDFADRSNGWDDAGSTRAGGHYNNGAYQVYAEPTGQGSTKGGAPRNASNMYPTAPPNLAIEVDAKALAIPEGTAYGIGCRMTDNGGVLSGYLFMLGINYVNISKYGIDGSYRLLSAATGTPLPSGFMANGTNRLEADCSGGEGDQAVSLVFRVNGQVAAQATDSKEPLTTGTIALLAEAYEDSKKAVEVQFDNLVVQA